MIASISRCKWRWRSSCIPWLGEFVQILAGKGCGTSGFRTGVCEAHAFHLPLSAVLSSGVQLCPAKIPGGWQIPRKEKSQHLELLFEASLYEHYRPTNLVLAVLRFPLRITGDLNSHGNDSITHVFRTRCCRQDVI